MGCGQSHSTHGLRSQKHGCCACAVENSENERSPRISESYRLSSRPHKALDNSYECSQDTTDVILQLRPKDKEVYSCFFPSDDDTVLLTAAKLDRATAFLTHHEAGEKASIRFWDLKRRQTNTGFFVDFVESPYSCTISPDGETIACVFKIDTLALVCMRSWSASSAEIIWMRKFWRGRRGALLCCTFSPDGNNVVTGSRLAGGLNHISIIDVETKKVSKSMPADIASRIRGYTTSCIFSPDGTLLAVSTCYGQLLICRSSDFQIVNILDMDSTVTPSCFSCLTSEQPSTWNIIQCWFLFDPKYGHRYMTSCLEDGTLQAWHLCDEQVCMECVGNICVLSSPWKKVKALCYSPDGLMLAVGTSDSQIIVLCSENLDTLFELNAHTQPEGYRTRFQNTEVCCLAFTRTCQQLAAAYRDGRVRLWQLPKIISLKHLCRLSLMKNIPANKIPLLPLPCTLVRYLLFMPTHV